MKQSMLKRAFLLTACLSVIYGRRSYGRVLLGPVIIPQAGDCSSHQSWS